MLCCTVLAIRCISKADIQCVYAPAPAEWPGYRPQCNIHTGLPVRIFILDSPRGTSLHFSTAQAAVHKLVAYLQLCYLPASAAVSRDFQSSRFFLFETETGLGIGLAGLDVESPTAFTDSNGSSRSVVCGAKVGSLIPFSYETILIGGGRPRFRSGTL